MRSSSIQESRTATLPLFETPTAPRLLYGVLFIEVSLFALVYYARYPLDHPLSGFFSANAYWALLFALLVSSLLLAYTVRTLTSSIAATAVFYFALHSNQLLYYGTVGGDTTSQVLELSLMARVSHITPSASPHFDYLAWPGHYLFATVTNSVVAFDDAVALVTVGYFVYSVVLLLAVWLFAYRFGDPFFAFFASATYFVLTFTVLNDQFVPQFLALILLVILFTLLDRTGLVWRVIEFALFGLLAITHLVFPLFYPAALMIRPAVQSLLASYRDDEDYSRLYQVLLHPADLLGRVGSVRTWLPRDNGVYFRIVGLWFVYLAVNAPELYGTLVSPFGRTAGNPIERILADLFWASSSTNAETVFLYDLAPRTLDVAVTWGSRVLLLLLFGILVGALLLNDTRATVSNAREYVDYRLEVLAASIVLFGLTMGLGTIYGLRILQVVFIPLALFYYGLRSHRRTVGVVLACLLVVSPVLLANGYVNNSLTAGGNTMGYHETQAGRTVGEHYDDPGSVIVPPHTPYPIGTPTDPRNADIRLVVNDERVAVPTAGLVIHSDRLNDFLRYRGYSCQTNVGAQTVVYDNGRSGAKVIWTTNVGGTLPCLT